MKLKDTLLISEIFYSLQGETTRAGLPCVFVRLSGCDLSCTYCDSKHSHEKGKRESIQSIVSKVEQFALPFVTITGGEPLLQNSVYSLMDILVDHGKTVAVETSGAHDISLCNPHAIRIMDIKCPSSGEHKRNYWPNIEFLSNKDEVKFVIGNRGDFDWAIQIVKSHLLTDRCSVLFSAVWNQLPLVTLGEWIRDSHQFIRLQLQLHKLLWGEKQGV